MEYVFGTKRDKEILKTKGGSHSDLKGYHEIERVYPDQVITDSFRIVEKYESAEDSEGNCYDWYEIDHHNRTRDRFTPAKKEIKTGIEDAQDALCALSEEIETRIADIEDALCSLTEEV